MLIPMKYTETHHTCDYHKRHPNKDYPGCTCGGSYGEVVKPMEDWTAEERRFYFGDRQ